MNRLAVVGEPLNSAMVVVYQTELSPLGVPVNRQKSLNNVRFDATEQAIYDAAHALFSLSEYSVIDVLQRKTYKLVDEEE